MDKGRIPAGLQGERREVPTPAYDLLRPTTTYYTPPQLYKRERREVSTLLYDLLRPTTTYYNLPHPLYKREEGSAHPPLRLAMPYPDLLRPTTYHSMKEKGSAHSPTHPFIRKTGNVHPLPF